MKKTACFLLAMVLMAAVAVPALAADVSASYDHGMLTVSTGANNWFRISVDGTGTGRSLTPKVPTLTFAWDLTDGEHRVSISSDIVGGGSVTIKVIDGLSQNTDESGEAAPTPTKQPEKIKEHSEHTPEEIPAVEPTCTKDGLTAGTKCKEGGEILTAQETVPALGHRYIPVSKTGDRITYQCLRCNERLRAGVKEAVKNRLGNIIVDPQGKPVNYKAAQAQKDENVLVLTVEKPFGEATLILDGSLIMQLFREGYDQVEFVNGKADLLIPLKAIQNSWFVTDGPISAYLFSTNPDADFETTLRVEAQVGNEKVATEQYSDLELK